MARPALPESSAHRSTRAFLAPCSRRSFAFCGATRAAARLIRLRSRPGLSPAACPRTCCSASRASSGSRTAVSRAMMSDLGVPQPPGPEQRLRAGQLDFEVPGQAQHLIGRWPVLGQRPFDLGGRGVQVRLRHPGAALDHGRAGGRTAAEQLRDRRVLEETGRCLGAVGGGDQPDDLVIGGLAQPGAAAGRLLEEPVQGRRPRRGIQALPGTEPARRAGRHPGNPLGGPGQPRPARTPLLRLVREHGPGQLRGLRPGQELRIGGPPGHDLVGLGLDRGQVLTPRQLRAVRVQVPLAVFRRRLVLIRVQRQPRLPVHQAGPRPGGARTRVLIRPGSRGNGGRMHAPSPVREKFMSRT